MNQQHTVKDGRAKPGRACMSFGGGVQSTAIALLALNQDPRLLDVTDSVVPELYLFADTGDERRATYAHVWKMAELFDHHGIEFQIVRRSHERLSDHIIGRNGGTGGGINQAPFFVETKEGGFAPLRRGCTAAFKIAPLQKAQRAHFKPPRGTKEPIWQQWLGISTDEASRMKDSDKPYCMIFHPLIWMRWSRVDCVEYLKTQTYLDGSPVQIVRSSCVYCPFHDSEEWRHVKSDPEDWKAAVRFDEEVRRVWEKEGIGGIKKKPFLHPSGRPIKELDFEEQSDQMSLWDNECAGVCGV
jgi:3'-phosphoadenosine 5'-phosphosulfate sulfotransferase (PAPS reductase)/FAD synthetase